jgi:deoxyadenosine/deoxycytidine kinase
MSILSNLINLDKKNDKYEYVKNHYNHDIDSDDLLYKYTNLNYIKKKSPIIVSIDGNIGSGKSTIVKYLKSNLKEYIKKESGSEFNICILEEPVNIWNEIVDKKDGKNIIEKYYEDQEKYSFAFQMMAYISRLSQIKKAIDENCYDIIITERSILTDKHIFAKMLYDDNKINDIEYSIYLKWFDEFNHVIDNIKIIYIKTSPEVSCKRVLKRQRLGENISLDYLKKCHDYHEDILKENYNIILINGNIEADPKISIDHIYYNMVMNKIYKFIFSDFTF